MSGARTDRRLAAGLALGVLASVPLCAQLNASPAAIEFTNRAINRAAKNANAVQITSGQSAEKRPLRGVVVSDPRVPPSTKARVLVIAGQHGNEPNPSLAISQLAAEWAASADFADLRRKSLVLFLPVANPDGFARGSRLDSAGADLNRDWGVFSRPETRAIAGLIERWRPHVLVDAHEWTGTDSGGPQCVEISGESASPELLEVARRLRAASLVDGVTSIDSRPGRSTGLFHRYFAHRGYAAYLIETSPYTPVCEKDRLYRVLIVAIVRGAVEKRKQIETCSRAGGKCVLPPEIIAWHCSEPGRNATPTERATVTVGACASAAACCLLMFGQNRRRPARWLRSLRRCSAADIGLTLTPRGLIPDLTSRSWVSRRTRSGHRALGRAAV